MSDSASGVIAGFLFQFEKALLMLADLKHPDETISVEDVDDIARHDEQKEEKILYTVQAKHSISASGSTFSDTSKALWRTIEIWVEKLGKGIFSGDTQFICSTNTTIGANFLVRKMKELPFEDVLSEVKKTLEAIQEKISEKQKESKTAPHLSEIEKKIKFVLKQAEHLKTICRNLILDDQVNVKPKFLEALRLNVPGVTTTRQDEVFDAFYGWLINTCFAKWKNAQRAVISKSMFDQKLLSINSSPQILYATFRQKEALGTLSIDKRTQMIEELFVRQINDINRGPGTKVILEKAIKDFIHHEIEISYVIEQGNFTGDDFNKFKKRCEERWEELFYQHVVKEEYTEEEINKIAINIYDAIMSENQLKFNGGFEFDLENRYIKNGSFLELSNRPIIGWRPDWQKKYKENE